MKRLEELKQMVENFELDYTKFMEKGNKTAGTRARKSLQEIRNWSKDVRMEISESKKSQTALMDLFIDKLNYIVLFMCLINIVRHIIKVVFKLINGGWRDKYELPKVEMVLLMLSLSYVLTTLMIN